MSESARGLDDDRLKRLVHDLEAIVRREPPWYDGKQHDPSIALIGNVAAVTIRWPPVPPLALEIHAAPGRISCAPRRRSWRDCLARPFGGRR